MEKGRSINFAAHSLLLGRFWTCSQKRLYVSLGVNLCFSPFRADESPPLGVFWPSSRVSQSSAVTDDDVRHLTLCT